ncbi:MAG: hypothetical protein AAB943_01785 [Patescibacteria group bacterium]
MRGFPPDHVANPPEPVHESVEEVSGCAVHVTDARVSKVRSKGPSELFTFKSTVTDPGGGGGGGGRGGGLTGGGTTGHGSPVVPLNNCPGAQFSSGGVIPGPPPEPLPETVTVTDFSSTPVDLTHESQ